MSRAQQVCPSQTVLLCVAQVEGHAFIPRRDRQRTSRSDGSRHAGQFIASAFPPDHATIQSAECAAERRLDVVRLQSSGAGVVHCLPQFGELGLREHFGRQGPLLQQFLQAVTYLVVDDFMHSGPHLGPVTVADGVDQQGAQRRLLEGLGFELEML